MTDNVQVIRNDREYQSLQKSLLSKKLKSVSKRYLNTSHQIYSGHPDYSSGFVAKFCPSAKSKPFFFFFHLSPKKKLNYTVTLAVMQALLTP